MDATKPDQQIALQNVSVLNNEYLVTIVDDMARDMKFYSIFYIIYGGFVSLTIFGAIIGIPIIIYNLKLKDAADQYKRFARDKDFFQLNKAFENQKKFFFFNKILIIIGLVFMLIYIFVLVYFGLSIFMSSPMGEFA